MFVGAPGSLNANSPPSSGLSAEILNKRPVRHFFKKSNFLFKLVEKKIINNKFLRQSHAKVTSVWLKAESFFSYPTDVRDTYDKRCFLDSFTTRLGIHKEKVRFNLVKYSRTNAWCYAKYWSAVEVFFL